MKNFLPFLIFTSFAIVSNAQTLSPVVISSAGGYYSGGGYSLSFTAGQPACNTLSSVSNKLSQGFQQPELDLRAGATIDSICAGAELNIPFYSTGYIGNNNIYTAQLSDASGSFASPLNIGNVVGNMPDTVHAIVPGNVPAGNNYKVRIVSDLPVRLSNSLTTITIELCSLDLSVYAFLEGFYIGGGMMTSPLYNLGEVGDPTICDSITVELHETVSPFGLLHTETALLKTDGTILCNVPAAMISSDYYIVLRTRNGIEVWSKFPVNLGLNTVFDFRN